MAMVLFPWVGRVNTAIKLGWVCDGRVTSKYVSRNHSARTIEVESASGRQRLEGVAPGLWDRANVGDRLVKADLSVTGTLNGRVVRVVPKQRFFGREPRAAGE